MTTFNWNCKTVDAYPTRDDHTDVVYNIHWIVTGVSDEVDASGNPYTATSIGTQTLDTSTIVDFIPFEDLTNEIAVEWTQATMGAESVSSIEDQIDAQIQDKITPTSVTLHIGQPEIDSSEETPETPE